ncbi:MAG: AAA domain-containing protein [Candidatus Paceibacterota bacterium]
MPKVTAKILEVFKRYKQAAIDFSRRNRLLKYPLKASKIEFNISLEECSSYFGSLDELNATFDHKKILKEEEQDNLFSEAEESDKKIQDPKYDTKTSPQGKKLISILERMRLQSKKSFDEHGLHTLFMAFGEVCWKEKTVGRGSTDSVKQQDYIAPLLLVPVSLENEKDPYKATILSVDTNQHPAQINPVLLLFIKENFELRLPNIPGTAEEVLAMPFTEVRKILSEIKEIFKEKGIVVDFTENIYLGQFSFHGQQIYEDLNKNQDEILKHDFINSVCGGDSFHQDNSDLVTIDEEEFNPDDFLNKEEDFTILDADGSQIQAIRKIVSGDHMVIHGPPGTGKSQTIANVISNLLARKKKVLFVCEKQVALDVVYKRLSYDIDGKRLEASVGDLCLPLFNYTNNKKSFSSDILDSRDSVASVLKKNKGVDLETKLKLRQKKIDSLKSYGTLITTPVAPLNKNIYWIFGELAKVNDKSKEVVLPWKGKSPLEFTLEDYHQGEFLIRETNHLVGLFSEESIWRSVARKHYSVDFSQRVIEALKETKECLLSLNKVADVSSFKNLKAIKETIELLSEGNNQGIIDNSYPKVKSLDSDYLNSIKASIEELVEMKSSYKTELAQDDKYLFPEDWKKLKELDISTIKKDAKIGEILSTRSVSIISTLSDLKLEIDKTIPAEVLDFSVRDFQSKQLLFQIDSYLSPIIKASRSQIYELRNSVKNLEVLYSQIQKSQDIIEKYGINLSEIESTKIIALEGIFLEKYKNIFRYFSSAYKADRKDVGSWCILRKPEKYSEIKNIIYSLAFRSKTQSKYDEEWKKIVDTFSLDQRVRHLSYEKINQGLESLIEYFEKNNIEYIEPVLQKYISDSKIHSILIQKTQKIEQITSSWNLLNTITSCNILEYSLVKVVDLIDQTEKEISEIRKSFTAVTAFISSQEHLPKDIVSLNKETGILNHLNQIINAVKKSKINNYIEASASKLLLEDETLNSFISYIESVNEFLAYLVPEFSEKASPKLTSLLLDFQKDIEDSNEAYLALSVIVEKLSGLFENDATKENMLSESYKTVLTEVNQMIGDSSGLEQWIEYKKKKHALEEIGMEWFMPEIAKLSIPKGVDLACIYSWAFFNKWIEIYSETNHELRDFTKDKFEKIIKEFKELERDSMEINRLRVLHEQLPFLQKSQIPCEADKKLRHEANKKMRHLPIRTLVQRYASHIQLMKPCWMVSPLALSSYLEYGAVNFDVVIFDEASQMKIENALGAIARAKQVVVIGDEHQLPPTSFFGVSLDGDEDEDEEVNEETGFESILQKSISLLNGSEAYLKYHYRSSSEDLIAFSNYHIYQNRLIAFPNPQNSRGIEFKFVNGVYDGSIITHKDNGEKERHVGTRTNIIEAEEVAKLCIEHVQNTPNKTIGVIAFSKSQEEAIRTALEEKLSKEHPHLTEYLDETSEKKDSFFIKNLESVQGDERDVIVLSICYGPDKTGKVFNRFGPLTSAAGYRRLNVAVTRAKDKLVCVTSMRFSDMSPSIGTRGAVLLQKYLEYAEKGSQVLEGNLIAGDTSNAEHDSDFEACVEKALTDIGYIVKRQVGVSGFKIDLAIVNPKNKIDYVLGIECDGAAYHSSKSARIRDRMRQDILEARGWNIYRIWSQHWYMHKQDVLNDIVQHVQSITR